MANSVDPDQTSRGSTRFARTVCPNMVITVMMRNAEIDPLSHM